MTTASGRFLKTRARTSPAELDGAGAAHPTGRVQHHTRCWAAARVREMPIQGVYFRSGVVARSGFLGSRESTNVPYHHSRFPTRRAREGLHALRLKDLWS